MKSTLLLFFISFIMIGCRTLSGVSQPFLNGFLTPNHHSSTSSNGQTPRLQSNSTLIETTNPTIVEASYDTSHCVSLGQLKQEKTPEAQKSLLNKAALEQADTVQFFQQQKVIIAKIYNCQQNLTPAFDLQETKIKRRQHNDLRLFAGKYFTRQGILRNLGKLGPTFGISFTIFSTNTNNSISRHGWFILWTFDHFFNTESKLLKPKFFDEDYTNYMLGFGYAFRWLPWQWLQIHYKGGLALNFIEIDTFGGGDDQKNREYRDITASTIHQLSIDFLIKKAQGKISEKRVGFSLLYYFCPDPLGKFSNDDNKEQTGGSLAWSIDFTFGIY